MSELTIFERVKNLFYEGKSKNEIVEMLGVKEKTVRNYIGELKNSNDQVKFSPNEKEISMTVNCELNIDVLSEKLGIDLNEWEPTQIVGNQWGDNKQLKIKYTKTISEESIYKAINNTIDKINQDKITTPIINYESDRDVLLEISVYDHHFGKLAHYNETGNNYDLNIAKSLYVEAIDYILDKSKVAYKIDKILFPIGQDLFHVNNESSTTAGGTFQDTDSRLTKIFETVQETLINCIDKMLKVAPVDIVYVPDNHGPLTSYFMCKLLEVYYRNNPNVNFDVDNRSRKYYQYGNTLIGMCHGHTEKQDVLALTMACEAKDKWANTEFHEFHLGHFHKKSEKKYNTVDSLGDVILRYLPSLCGTDKWHETKAYNTTRKFCECYLFDKENGPIGSLIYNKKKE